MPKKLKFEKDDLIGDTLSIQKELSLNIPIVGFNNNIKGQYSFFRKKKVFFWEGNIVTGSEMMVSFTQSIKSSYCYLLSFESYKNLNRRLSIDLPINADLLDNQSKKGSLFWVSSVGIELMIPDNTQIDFQLIGIPQDTLLEYVTDIASSQLSSPFLKKRHDIPFFYFSENTYLSNASFFRLGRASNSQEKKKYVLDMMNNYLHLFNNDSLSRESSFRDFYNMFLLEKEIRQSSAVREPNINLLSVNFGYSAKKLKRLFFQVFGISIIEYHRGFHMKYAKWLIEEKQMKIEEVSKLLGFNSTTLFAKVFKRHYFYVPQKCKPKRE